MIDVLTLLPKYNPSPVFIFNNEGECFFKNSPASDLMPKVTKLSHLYEVNMQKFISNEEKYSVTFTINNKYYLINLVGVEEENIIMAYAQDITQLVQSIEKEKIAIASKDDFFRNISHEMRTPLNAIIGFSPIIKKALSHDKKTSTIYNMLDENSHKLNKLIDQILDVQKVKTGSLEIINTTFNILPLLDNLFKDAKIIAEEKGHDFRVHVNKSSIPTTLRGDGDKIIQIIDSILDNAIKFTDNDGIVACKISYNENVLSITIKDNGIGIDAQEQIKIFTVKQIDASTTRQYEGAGLGLFLVSETLNAMNGTIELKSKLKEGSEFFIKIPIS